MNIDNTLNAKMASHDTVDLDSAKMNSQVVTGQGHVTVSLSVSVCLGKPRLEIWIHTPASHYYKHLLSLLLHFFPNRRLIGLSMTE